MFIQEAVKKAFEEHKCITKKNNRIWRALRIKVKPTNTTACCIISVKDKQPRGGWQPNASDLMANDWEVID